ncbi:ABC transporter ATP-binding protein [Halalkalibacter nanhaiisediminis]|uniref:Carnitine transport ATP-binding protein OpuCA n=1 Tax=Halalkalibacter nanhaiisediminis TaxID=688079 RepID=A0A562QBB6_9BACI|nr:ABC transporter ATP-binding protein [Halalkalibacter nanhaiisediminis]TWI54047.1 iron(III) transport system ATP-binding protein [Halalkalibacter nanhaiisediminis]
MSFIQLRQLTKQYKQAEQPAVDHIELEIEKGEIITLLGPSGCGKTTTLRMIAGFEQPTSGVINIGGSEVFGEKTYVPPEKREIGMVFQDYALFPHLTIEKNVVFGLNKWSTREKKARAKEVLELVGLAEYGKRYPNELSGGQQQRVALARALAPRPHVVLMDEPFSNLDAGLRERMRYDVTSILRKANTTAIIVTHDQKDAFAVSDRVVVMNQGVIQQIATPRDMYRCPKNCFVAQFVGKTNLLTGTLCSDLKHVDTYIGRVSLPTQSEKIIEDVRVSIRPEGCRLAENGRYSGKVERVTYSGEYQEVEVRLGERDLSSEPMVVYAPVEQEIEIGAVISFDIKPELVALVEV